MRNSWINNNLICFPTNALYGLVFLKPLFCYLGGMHWGRFLSASSHSTVIREEAHLPQKLHRSWGEFCRDFQRIRTHIPVYRAECTPLLSAWTALRYPRTSGLVLSDNIHRLRTPFGKQLDREGFSWTSPQTFYSLN